jgi:hypothetical protein
MSAPVGGKIRESQRATIVTSPAARALGGMIRRACCRLCDLLFRQTAFATPRTCAADRTNRQRGFVDRSATFARDQRYENSQSGRCRQLPRNPRSTRSAATLPEKSATSMFAMEDNSRRPPFLGINRNVRRRRILPARASTTTAGDLLRPAAPDVLAASLRERNGIDVVPP